MIFEDFFSQEYQDTLLPLDRKIALSLVSPNQVVHAIPTYEKDANHFDLSLSIIADIYKLSKPVFDGNMAWYRYALLTNIRKVIKNDESNFIFVRYILLRNGRIAIVEAPWYITEYERNMLIELNKLFEDFNISIDFIIHRYDPINMEVMKGSAEGFGHDEEKSAIEMAIDYYEKYNSIIDYELLAPKEYILK